MCVLDSIRLFFFFTRTGVSILSADVRPKLVRTDTKLDIIGAKFVWDLTFSTGFFFVPGWCQLEDDLGTRTNCTVVMLG